jgi:hypothetical protein
VTPREASAGPEARRSSGSLPDPLTANPTIRMLPPVPTCARVDRFESRPTSVVAVTETVAGVLVVLPALFVATQV